MRNISSLSGDEKPNRSEVLAQRQKKRTTSSKRLKRVFENYSYGVVLYQGDCLDVLDELLEETPDGRFDMIFADPPYFLSNGGMTCHSGKQANVDKGKWDKSQGPVENHKFNQKWLSKCQQLLNPNGTLWVSGTHHIIYSIGFAMQELGFKILNNITWEKSNPPPNLSCRYFTHSTETIIWAAKNGRSKHRFDYDSMRNANGGKQMKSVWKMNAPRKDEKEFGKHPTQKPLSLLTRIIKASTDKNDMILDPFSGSATTGIAAIQCRRQFIGCEISDEYVDLSKQRLTDAILSDPTK